MAEKKSNGITWPAERQALSIRGYRLKYARPCRLCGTKIEFWSTPNHKLIPLEKTVNDLRLPHHSTCPKAAEFQKKRAEGQGDLFAGENPVGNKEK